MQEFRYEKDADGIVTVTMDMSGQSANTMNARYVPAMDETLNRLRAETDLTGVIFASAKKTFFAGGDLHLLLGIDHADAQTLDYVEQNKRPYREIERLPVPVVAAINGAALGGGYELCLACNHRVILDVPQAVVGLPEVTLGLLPGAGGVVRLTALLGLEAALPFLTEGRQLGPRAALAAGLVDQVVAAPDGLIAAARAWILANPDSHTQPWDRKGFRYPGGDAAHPRVRQVATMGAAVLVSKTRGLLPAPARIMDVAVNSMRMGFDSALRNESRGLCALLPTPEAKAAITTFFFGMQKIKSGKVRPDGPQWRPRRAGVIGAGMMGAGIAWAQAAAGLPTWISDTDPTRARAGRARAVALAEARVAAGRMAPDACDALSRHITATDDPAAMQGADLLIEAVYEDLALKQQVIAASFGRLSEGGILASNTSTLPISVLAESCPAPERFVGLHFFSPVERMKIVEIVQGARTSPDTLRMAYDYVRQIGYLPFVVRDSRGFFTSRVFGTYLDEGQRLVLDGMAPVAVERAAWIAGMPSGPLAVHDEVSLVLSRRVHDTHRDLDALLGVKDGYPADTEGTRGLAFALLAAGRGGRHHGGGFYDYPTDGEKRLWPGLSDYRGTGAVSVDDAVERLLMRQAIEALRCLDEEVVRSEVEANLASILAIGFPSHTGGAIQYIRGIGIDRFARRAADLAQAHGPRFAVSGAALERLRGDPAAAA
ncbi:MAG: 3-hydroxyacyl-CoA dehydrogenase NAD-binding domain-containing protein [Rhodobacteraceae bacterium]|nr:3-hydroxyacyl-CoA dehydrogenase NAD-binding domain-containing protein [Paracoccaceae bacterium]